MDLVKLLFECHLPLLIVTKSMQSSLDFAVFFFLSFFLEFHSGFFYGRLVFIEVLVLTQF